MTRAARIALVLAAAIGACAPGAALAQRPPSEAELAAARERFREGLALEEAEDWASARRKFEQVAATKTTPQVLFHLALCDEKLGALRAAARGYEAALAAAAEAGPSAEAVAETTRAHQEALAPRIPRIRVEVVLAQAGDELTVDGRPTERGAAEAGVEVDPGARRVALARDGRQIAEKVVRVAEGERATVRLEGGGEPTPPPPPPPPPPAPPAPSAGGTRVPAIVVGSVGLASLVGAGVTFGLSQAAVDEVLLTCRDPDGATGCDPSTRGSEDDARTLSTVSIVLGGVGAACLVTGAVLWLTLGDEPDGGAVSARRGPRVGVAPTPLGAAAFGRF